MCRIGQWLGISLLLAVTAQADQHPPGSRPPAERATAIEIAKGVYQAPGIGHTNLVATEQGRVIIDTGLPIEAPRHRRALDLAAPGPVRYVVLTHAHLDHAGGAATWTDEGSEIITHEKFPETQRYLTELLPFQMPRNRVLVFGASPDQPFEAIEQATRGRLHVDPTILVDDVFEFELGGVEFEVIATPGAEGEDSISVWLPERKILFTGDFLGPVFPSWPTLYSLRGEKFRFPLDYIRSLDRVIALKPEMLVPSHHDPIVGRREIRSGLERIRDAVTYVHDAVVRGMNSSRTVYELMREIELPEDLELREERGKVSWAVRSIWEAYAGWFHFTSTTQLYPVPISDLYPEIAELSGGADVLARRAGEHLRDGKLVEALHFSQIALAADSGHALALQTRLDALALLLDQGGGENVYETQWLRYRIAETRRELDPS